MAAGAGLIARSLGHSGRLGIELEAWPLIGGAVCQSAEGAGTGRMWRIAVPSPQSLRQVKSPAEIAMMRRAAPCRRERHRGRLSLPLHPAFSERELAASASAAMVRAGSDPSRPGRAVLRLGRAPSAWQLHRPRAEGRRHGAI